MIEILPAVILFVLSISLFFREIKLDSKRFLEEERLADEHILREVERFLKEQPDFKIVK
ncbi:MAG: hypothetical protein WC662_02250 [Candidatus Paceibacterota bacterium]|jgi:hypothetical protein